MTEDFNQGYANHGRDYGDETLTRQRVTIPPAADRWLLYFLRLACEAASMSKDPSTRVGAILVNDRRSIIAAGFNGFPRRLRDSAERLADREQRLALTVHAELNAILQAAEAGISTRNTTLYYVWQDVATGEYYGGPPCVRCAVELIQAGVTGIFGYNAPMPVRWEQSSLMSRIVLDEAQVPFTEIDR
jgi:dCMP deaminase